ncbi:MAG TPA: hypothetical protein VFX51_01985 [Solirubrobacteraceae bacterium]|nr:hypothetical protein [Solirubrobacteraceae bacterium]
MVTRRAVVLGGGAALLATGCGKDLVREPPPAAPALRRSLAAERSLGASLVALQERGDRALLRRLATRSRRRSDTLAAALSELGARPHEVGELEARADIAAGLRRGHAALEAYVAALPALVTRARREVGADLLAEAAGDVALLGNAFGSPPSDPFPGTPA